MERVPSLGDRGAADWREIVELTSRMGLLVDARDWQALRELFADRVEVDYTSLRGGEPQTLSSEDLIGGWRELLDPLDATQHLIATHVIALEGDRAKCATNVQGTHVLSSAVNEATFTVAGRYDFALRRRASGWRIAGLKLTVQWTSGNRDVLDMTGRSS